MIAWATPKADSKAGDCPGFTCSCAISRIIAVSLDLEVERPGDALVGFDLARQPGGEFRAAHGDRLDAGGHQALAHGGVPRKTARLPLERANHRLGRAGGCQE